MNRLFIVLFILLLSSFAFGGDYIIGEGDVLDVSVWGVEKLSLSAIVRPDGKITIPALGDVTASGLIPKDLQALLTEKLKVLVKNPIVTISVTTINNNKVYVFGGGVESGVYALSQKTTLLQFLTNIPGIRNTNLEEALVIRNKKKVKKGFYKLFIDGNLAEDILMEPNDIVFIPAFVEKNVYVVGAVNAPIYVEYREGLTVMEAILKAGGFTKFARQNSTVIYRKQGDSKVEIPAKLKNLIQDGDMSQNIKLQPGDYVFVKQGMF